MANENYKLFSCGIKKIQNARCKNQNDNVKLRGNRVALRNAKSKNLKSLLASL